MHVQFVDGQPVLVICLGDGNDDSAPERAMQMAEEGGAFDDSGKERRYWTGLAPVRGEKVKGVCLADKNTMWHWLGTDVA